MPSKAPGSPQERRSGAGLGMGTNPGSQSLVAPLSQTQTNVWVLYKVGVPGVYAGRGGVEGCLHPGAAGTSTRPSTHAVSPAGAPARGRPLAPPPRRCTGGGHPQFFPTFSTTIFFKENVNVH